MTIIDTSLETAIETSSISIGSARISPALGRDEVIAEISALVGERTDTAPIAPDDNFFDLGVESLMLVEIKESIHDRFAVTVKFSDFFTHFTVEALADLVIARATNAATSAATSPVSSPVSSPVTAAVAR